MTIQQLLGKVQRFTKEEELELWENWYHDKCINSRNRLILSVLPLAIRLSKRWETFYTSQEELLQIATIAMLQIMDSFDARVARLTTFVHRKIYWFCQQNYYENRVIPLPRSTITKRDYVTQKLFDEGVLSLEMLPELPENLNDEEVITEELLHMRQMIEELPERLKEIIKLRLQGKTLSTIGKKLKISKERVRQLECRAINQMKIKAKILLRRDQ